MYDALLIAVNENANCRVTIFPVVACGMPVQPTPITRTSIFQWAKSSKRIKVRGANPVYIRVLLLYVILGKTEAAVGKLPKPPLLGKNKNLWGNCSNSLDFSQKSNLCLCRFVRVRTYSLSKQQQAAQQQ